MKDPVPVVRSVDVHSLDAIAAGVQAAHARCEGAARDALRHAMEAGRLLIAAKGRIPHGGFLAWLGACGVSERTGQTYMRLARHAAELAEAQRAAPLSLREAVKLLAEPAAPAPPIGDAAPDWRGSVSPAVAAELDAHADAIREAAQDLPYVMPSVPPPRRRLPQGYSYTVWRDMTPESRRETVGRWPNLRFEYAALFDAAGWSVDRIAGEMGVDVGVVSAALDPRPPARFTNQLNGLGMFGGADGALTRTLEGRFRDGVTFLLATWAGHAYEGAAGRAEYEGFPELAAGLSAVAADHKRRAARLPEWPAPYFADRADNVAMNCCALTDARIAKGIEDGADGPYEDLAPMFFAFKEQGADEPAAAAAG